MKRPNLRPPDEFVASGLAFLADDAGRFDRFLALTGLAVGELRSLAGTDGFAESLLDYLCSDDRLLLAFAAHSGVEPGEVEAMRQSLAPAPFEG